MSRGYPCNYPAPHDFLLSHKTARDSLPIDDRHQAPEFRHRILGLIGRQSHRPAHDSRHKHDDHRADEVSKQRLHVHSHSGLTRHLKRSDAPTIRPIRKSIRTRNPTERLFLLFALRVHHQRFKCWKFCHNAIFLLWSDFQVAVTFVSDGDKPRAFIGAD